jgi:hypothetical protein
MAFRRISKAEAKKRFANGLTVVFCPCKMRPGGAWAVHSTIFGENLAERLERAERHKDNPQIWKGTAVETAWDILYREWAHYNASSETGRDAHYYVEG